MFNWIYWCVNTFSFKIKLLNINAQTPYKADDGCAGYDLFSSEEATIQPGTRSLISTGISVEIPRHYYFRVAPRSGLSVHGLDIGAGVIDSSYRGEIKVLCINNSKEPFHFERGAKIAQMILERCACARIELVNDLSETTRGSGGFGSTGN
jgi:dUTP pyrophosphatase